MSFGAKSRGKKCLRKSLKKSETVPWLVGRTHDLWKRVRGRRARGILRKGTDFSY